MTGLKVYVDLMSQPSRAIMMFLKSNKIVFDTKVTSISKGENKSDEYLKIHPFGKVPAIQDDGFNLIESVAILRYLARKYNVPEHWYPKDPYQQAKVDEFLEWQHIGLRVPAASFFFQSFLVPLFSGKPASDKDVSFWKTKTDESLSLMESIWLKNTNYVVGNKISIADLLAICEIEQTILAGYNPSEGRPKLTAWLTRCHNDLNPHYNEVHQVFNKVLNKKKVSSNM